ncbi:hypothetical protein [Gemmobacter sp.]|uniref:hypothetical protein n=1 Tax=Gemmobacter sp. TaxID=1898957 RepID=UPI002AFF1790|nr:hypothetical protein [Gemmobacter sp.]
MTRHRTATTLLRETGLALAMLAVWMLALLAPLHQTSGLLRAFAETGHVLPGGWSICVTLAQDDDGPAAPVPQCPAQAIGKADLGLPPAPVVVALVLPPAQPARWPDRVVATAAAPPWTPVQPRAPPARI